MCFFYYFFSSDLQPTNLPPSHSHIHPCRSIFFRVLYKHHRIPPTSIHYLQLRSLPPLTQLPNTSYHIMLLAQSSAMERTRTPASPTASGTQTSTSTPSAVRTRAPDGTLRLRGGPIEDRRVRWDQGVIDNEGMGKKKSKGATPSILVCFETQLTYRLQYAASTAGSEPMTRARAKRTQAATKAVMIVIPVLATRHAGTSRRKRMPTRRCQSQKDITTEG